MRSEMEYDKERAVAAHRAALAVLTFALHEGRGESMRPLLRDLLDDGSADTIISVMLKMTDLVEVLAHMQIELLLDVVDGDLQAALDGIQATALRLEKQAGEGGGG